MSAGLPYSDRPKFPRVGQLTNMDINSPAVGKVVTMSSIDPPEYNLADGTGISAAGIAATGINTQIQINDSGVFGVGAKPTTLDADGNLTTTHEAGAGEIRGTAFAPPNPISPDTWEGHTAIINNSKVVKYNMITNGLFRSAPHGQLPLANGSAGAYGAGFGFPANNVGQIWTNPGHSIDCRNCIIGCRSSVGPIPPAGSGECIMSSVVGTDDVAYYDPLNMRVKTLATQSTGICWNVAPMGTRPGMLRIEAFADVTWSAAAATLATPNRLKIIANRFNLANVFQFATTIGTLECVGTNFTGTAIRTLQTFNGNADGQPWAANDYWRIGFLNDHAANDVTINFMQVVADWWANP